MAENLKDLVFDSYVPRRYLRNRHAMTLAGNFLRRKSDLPAPEECLYRVDADTQVLCHCHWHPDSERRATVIIVHGLEGSSLSQYVIGNATKAWNAGMNVVRMNMRTCGGTGKLTPTLYHSGLSSDVGAVLRTVIEEKKASRVGLIGYSMGGNLVLKLAGELGANAPVELKAIAAVSPAADLAASADAMHVGGNRIYEWKFLVSLMRTYERKRKIFPEIYRKIQRFPSTIREFDDVVTARYCGFESAEDYYTRSGAYRVIENIALPTLVIHAIDDPFIRLLPETRAKILANLHITLLETAHGGHCAFLAQPNGYDGRWAERQIMHFFQHHGMS
ncbi:MAG: Alpha/beta hydrolase [Candidatus Angelobacter sp.]|nr:Alpha/beta hydrolase [Candidatus Angelobacter sp.]